MNQILRTHEFRRREVLRTVDNLREEQSQDMGFGGRRGLKEVLHTEAF